MSLWTLQQPSRFKLPILEEFRGPGPIAGYWQRFSISMTQVQVVGKRNSLGKKGTELENRPGAGNFYPLERSCPLLSFSHPLPPFLFPYFTYWVLGGQGWYVSAFTEASESFLPQMSQPGRLQVNIPPCWSPQENKGNRTRREVGAPEIYQRQKRMRHQEDTRSLKTPANMIEAVLPALPHICFPHVVCRVSGDRSCCVDVFTKASGKPKLQNSPIQRTVGRQTNSWSSYGKVQVLKHDWKLWEEKQP